VLVAVVVFMSVNTVERFSTTDTQREQRQELQWEGERRYNDLARLQDPNIKISAQDAVTALGGEQSVPGKATSSLRDLIPTNTLMPADDGSNKQGMGVEQTGTLQDKINFCESIQWANCDMMDDPRFAECGICHAKGTNSQGKPHRGGLFMSSDDQIRANEVSAKEQKKARYKPTFGTCDPTNFTLMKDRCVARENQLKCESAGAAMKSNQCGQCYGGGSAGTSSLLYVGPKPKMFDAILHISHPGINTTEGGVGTIVTLGSGGSVVRLWGSGVDTQKLTFAASTKKGIDPKTFLIEIFEGQSINIQVYGFPHVWCAWLESLDGRYLPLDVGIMNRDALPIGVAGDKNSPTVARILKNDPEWKEFKEKVPKTALWFERKEGSLPGGVVKASWGVNDVTDVVRTQAANFQDIPVNNKTYGSPNPPGVDEQLAEQKKGFAAIIAAIQASARSGAGASVAADPTAPPEPTNGILKITLDNGKMIPPISFGGVLKKEKIYNYVSIDITVPASFVTPYYQEDRSACPTSNMILTETGAGIMASNSCFKADGTFNTTPFCLQELFLGAGGTQQGEAWPADASKIAPLLRPSAAAPSFDQTTLYMNNLGSIASYGVDTTGKVVSFEEFKAACKAMLGYTPMNPCEGPTKNQGPHSAPCLDYLWRTSGNPAADQSRAKPDTWPYNYCGVAGSMAPIRPDGSINDAAVDAANEQGGMVGVRQWYSSMYQRAHDPSDFNTQSTSARDCFGLVMKNPPPKAEDCPTPGADEWQPFPTVLKISPDRALSFASVGSPNKYLSFPDQGQLWKTQPVSDDNTKRNATIAIRNAQNGQSGYISFASSFDLNKYLRHAGFVAQLGIPDGSTLFNEDASFRVVAGLDGNPKHVSFQSSNYPTRYLARREDDVVVLAQDFTLQNASWTVEDSVLRTSWYNGLRATFDGESSYWLVREQSPRLGDQGKNTQCISNTDTNNRTKCVVYNSEKEAQAAAAALPPNPQTSDLSARDGSGWTTPWASAIDNFLRARA
jgi:hypothetical protein